MHYFKHILVGAVFFSGVTTALFAMDDVSLAEMLVRKGVISPHELNVLKRQEVYQKEQTSAKNMTAMGDNGLPSWVAKMKWSGDMRMRYENFTQPGGTVTIPDRNRYRIRARVGFEAQVNDEMKMGMRLVTGGNNPTSTNQTLDDAFDTKSIDLDRAYIKYEPREWATVIMGKFGNPFFSTDLVFDDDLSFDGFAGTTRYAGEYGDAYVTLGLFPLDEVIGENNVPWMYGLQTGAIFNPFEETEMELGLATYAIKDIYNYDLQGAAGLGTGGLGNAVDAGTNGYQNGFQLIDLAAKMNFFWDNVPVKLVADYVNNFNTEDPATENDNTGYQFGVHLGKAQKPKTLEAFLYYKKLESEAVLDVFTDSDFGGGGTNHKGFKTGLKYQLQHNSQVGLTYYDTSVVDDRNAGVLPTDQKTIQVDMSVKF